VRHHAREHKRQPDAAKTPQTEFNAPQVTKKSPVQPSGWRVQSSATHFYTSVRLGQTYISTQSNIIAKVEQGTERLEDVLLTIQSGVREMLGEARGNFLFGGTIWLLSK
jgi:hypothetical protein